MKAPSDGQTPLDVHRIRITDERCGLEQELDGDVMSDETGCGS